MFLSRVYPSTQFVRPTPHSRLDPRRTHRPRQSELALQIPPHPLPAKRLDLPHQHRRFAGMDTALVDRPTTTTPNQRPHPTPPRPTTTTPPAPPANTRCRMKARVLSLRWSTVGFDKKQDEQSRNGAASPRISWQLPTAGRLAAPFDRPRIFKSSHSHRVKRSREGIGSAAQRETERRT